VVGTPCGRKHIQKSRRKGEIKMDIMNTWWEGDNQYSIAVVKW
jgi:hypothetical protein